MVKATSSNITESLMLHANVQDGYITELTHVSRLFQHRSRGKRTDSPPSHGVSSGLQSKADKKVESSYPSILKQSGGKHKIKQSDYITQVNSTQSIFYPIQLTQIWQHSTALCCYPEGHHWFLQVGLAAASWNLSWASSSQESTLLAPKINTHKEKTKKTSIFLQQQQKERQNLVHHYRRH